MCMMEPMAKTPCTKVRTEDMQNIYSATNPHDAVEAIVFKGEFSYLVRLYDNDDKEFLPPHVWFDTEQQAKDYADKCMATVITDDDFASDVE